VTLADLVPFGGQVHVYRAFLPGSGADSLGERASVNRVWTGFFSTLRIPIVEGRDFTAADLGPGVNTAIISATMARRLWPDGPAVGQRFSLGDPADPPLTVVGVARDVRVDEFSERPWSAVWLPHAGDAAETVIIASSSRASGVLLKEIEDVIRGLDGNLPIHAARPLRTFVAERLNRERALSKLLVVSGVLAIGLAALGLYSLTAYGVSLRRREIGVRMALGADLGDVRNMFVGEGLRLAARGALWGLLPALGATYALSGAIVGLFPIDPLTLTGAALVLAAATTTAAYLPARRAARVDPIDVLRAE
jgi:hypothetical protein